MHELSIALSILDMIEEEAARLHVTCVTAVYMKLGPLSGVMKGPLLSAYELAREGTPLTECELRIEEMPIVAHCPICAADIGIASMQEMLCPQCGSPATDIVSGRELEVAALEFET